MDIHFASIPDYESVHNATYGEYGVWYIYSASDRITKIFGIIVIYQFWIKWYRLRSFQFRTFVCLFVFVLALFGFVLFTRLFIYSFVWFVRVFNAGPVVWSQEKWLDFFLWTFRTVAFNSITRSTKNTLAVVCSEIQPKETEREKKLKNKKKNGSLRFKYGF